MKSINDIKALFGVVGHRARGREVLLLGPGARERDEAVDGVGFPGCVCDGAVFGAEICGGLDGEVGWGSMGDVGWVVLVGDEGARRGGEG